VTPTLTPEERARLWLSLPGEVQIRGLREGDSERRRTNGIGRDSNPEDAPVAPPAAVPLAESDDEEAA